MGQWALLDVMATARPEVFGEVFVATVVVGVDAYDVIVVVCGRGQ